MTQLDTRDTVFDPTDPDTLAAGVPHEQLHWRTSVASGDPLACAVRRSAGVVSLRASASWARGPSSSATAS